MRTAASFGTTSRHRSPVNFMVNLLGGLIAYCHQPKKPAIENDGKLQVEPAPRNPNIRGISLLKKIVERVAFFEKSWYNPV